MIGLVALLMYGVESLTYDAMSPIKDAVISKKLYTSKPSYLKITNAQIAFKLASDKKREWQCPCPFCTKFTQEHPFRYDIGQLWTSETNPKVVTERDLSLGGSLYDAYPLLSEPIDKTMRAAIRLARIGHNHWVIDQIMSELNEQSTTHEHLKQHIEKIVARYKKQAKSQHFAEAIGLAYQIAAGSINDLVR